MNKRKQNRGGQIAFMTAIMLIALIGILACAFDIGWIMMTKTQLHAAADSAALAGGTELKQGLGVNSTATPDEVSVAARAAAVFYAAKNSAGDKANVYVDGARDIVMGTAKRNKTTLKWEFVWGDTPYNAIKVSPKRNVDGGGNDGPLQLFFAPVIGNETAELATYATAVILPSNGFQVVDPDERAPLMPFAFERALWDKYKRARDYFTSELGSDPSLINESIEDIDGTPLFYIDVPQGSHTVREQVFDDNWSWDETGGLTEGQDTVLEVSIFPIGQTSGNFGTIDLGSGDNSTNDIKRQIVEGLNMEDLSYFPDGKIVASPDLPPLEIEGDTGISGGIENALQSIEGECRAIALFLTVSGPGNNSIFRINEFVGIRIMEVELGGSNKRLVVQPCKLDDDTSVPDDDDDIDENTTLFTPLIIAQ